MLCLSIQLFYRSLYAFPLICNTRIDLTIEKDDFFVKRQLNIMTVTCFQSSFLIITRCDIIIVMTKNKGHS